MSRPQDILAIRSGRAEVIPVKTASRNRGKPPSRRNHLALAEREHPQLVDMEVIVRRQN